MPKTKQTFFQRLRSFFGVSVRTKDGEKVIEPGTTNPPTKKDKDFKNRPIGMPDELKAIYDAWIGDVFDNSDSFKDRIERYEDLEFAYYNNAIFSTAVDLYADETTQMDSQSNIIQVYAKNSKVEKYITEFFERIGLDDNLMKAIAFDVSLYGDAFLVHSFSKEEGITEVVPVGVKAVTDRFEFNAINYQEKVAQKHANSYQVFFKQSSNYEKLAQVLDAKDNTIDFSSAYKSYLFGYEVSNMMIPPWGVTHCRRLSTNSEFHPFGRPIMINAIAPFKQLQASKNLMALLRGYKFPIRKFEVKNPDGNNPAQAWETLENVRSDFYNQGEFTSTRDTFATQTDIWTVENLFDVNQIENRLDLKDIADVELLQDNLVIATRIPKGYLITDRGGFGQSGQSLMQQSKIFGRGVYTIQTAILEALTDLVRLQFVISGDYDYDEEFELGLAFPLKEDSGDQIKIQNDTLRLAKDILDNLGTAIGLDRGESLPIDIVRQVFSKYSFLDAEEIEEWIETYIDATEHPKDESTKLKVRNKINERLFEDTVRSAYFQAKKKNNLDEGVMNQKHYYNSSFMTRKKADYFESVKKDLQIRARNGKLEEGQEEN